MDTSLLKRMPTAEEIDALFGRDRQRMARSDRAQRSHAESIRRFNAAKSKRARRRARNLKQEPTS